VARHTFKLSTVSRAIRAARNAGVSVDRVEIDEVTGSVILHMDKPAEKNAAREGRSAPAVKQQRTST
jgi:hypothetical protein